MNVFLAIAIMNVFLAILRRIALGGIVLLVLSLVLKGSLPAGKLGYFCIACPFVYLILQFFSWLSAKHITDEISDELGIDIESNNYYIFSPLIVIFTLFKDTSVKWVMFIATYAIILAYVGIWFFVIR